MKKQILSHTQQKWQSAILGFSKNIESYHILDWISWDRKWVFHTILSFTQENMNFSRCIQIKGIWFFISSSNYVRLSRMKSSWPTHNIKNWNTTLKKMDCLLALTHFKLMFHFYTLWKHKKQTDFLMFSGGTEMEHWLQIG